MNKRNTIHPTAIVEEGVILGEGVVVEPFAIVKNGVHLRDGVTVKSHAYIEGNTTIGEQTIIYPFASIGSRTQDLKYVGEKTYVKIGKRCHIREGVTINSSCGAETTVSVGDDCLIMAYCHIAHNCEVGNRVILSNNVALAGHVIVEDDVIVGGITPVHQFSRIGKHAMVGGLSRVTHDIPPFTIGGGVPFKFGGLNLIGLKRRNFPHETIRELAKAFRFVYRSSLSLQEALAAIETECKPLPEVLHWLHFCQTTKRGLIGLSEREKMAEEGADKEKELELLAT